MTTDSMTAPVAWVTGASSGMGRTSALALAEQGHPVALTARRADQLERTADEIRASGGSALVVPADLSRPGTASTTVKRIADEFGPVGVAVFSAGLNTKERMWDGLRPDEFRRILELNLSSIVEATTALLPRMREHATGQLILISSWAAWRHSPGAGVAYAASKTALGAIAETLNAQEGRHGIRACHLCPGDVNTDFLDHRPTEVPAGARAQMLDPQDVSRAVAFIASSPASVCVNELVITPTGGGSYR
ncbi:SDR family NAD(P)-dependent oxidoreductase [Microbacterium sp. PRC9]|uniref:SDR family oxidoreductase n=1 Tax=Microbacterium sp. PRC9 TaxID=2962591 RepID=UPI002882438F|nr:SDR family NAD(P)-dependent oxidoreductase [Microbacterium sp. PRC9]MDT0143164.1 SDR family NAD(P)-dependent oxidoreductase [Microbacterium sp. PRC9]